MKSEKLSNNAVERVILDYSYALETLDRYDYQTLEISNTTDTELFQATYENMMEAINILKGKFGSSNLFGNNTIVALTLLIAESRSEDMDMMIKVIINLINRNN